MNATDTAVLEQKSLWKYIKLTHNKKTLNLEYVYKTS